MVSACKKASSAPRDPAIVAALHRLMVAEAFGQIAPAAARAGHPQQRVDEAPVVAARPALAGSAARHKILQPLPLIVAQRIHIPNHQG